MVRPANFVTTQSSDQSVFPVGEKKHDIVFFGGGACKVYWIALSPTGKTTLVVGL